jgi:hypothetical protein
MMMASNPIGTEISHQMSRLAEGITEWLEHLSPPLSEVGE